MADATFHQYVREVFVRKLFVTTIIEKTRQQKKLSRIKEEEKEKTTKTKQEEERGSAREATTNEANPLPFETLPLDIAYTHYKACSSFPCNNIYHQQYHDADNDGG